MVPAIETLRRIFGFERRADHLTGLTRANAELTELIHGECRRRALQHARQLLRERDRAKRRGGRYVVYSGGPYPPVARLQISIQPAVRRALHAGRRRFHVVLRVEVRPGAVGRSARVHDGELARIP